MKVIFFQGKYLRTTCAPNPTLDLVKKRIFKFTPYIISSCYLSHFIFFFFVGTLFYGSKRRKRRGRRGMEGKCKACCTWRMRKIIIIISDTYFMKIVIS